MHLFSMHAGQKKTIAYLHIPTMMAPPAKREVPSNKRRKLSVLMIVRLGQPNFVAPLSGSKFEGMPPSKQYQNRKQQDTNDLTAQEYADKLQDYAGHARYRCIGAPRPQAGAPVRVLHDRDRAHGGQEVKDLQVQIGLETEYFPPKDADLNPLDYGIFGVVKQKWEADRAEHCLTWDQECDKFLSMLKEVDADPIIRALPARMKACIAAKGKRFEREYRKGHSARAKAAKARQ